MIGLGHLLITRWIVWQNAFFEIWGPAGTERQMDKRLDYLDRDIEIRRAHMIKRERPLVAVTEIEEGKILEAGWVTMSAFSVDHDPGKLVITHMMPASVPAELEAAAKRHHPGPVMVGEDLLEI